MSNTSDEHKTKTGASSADQESLSLRLGEIIAADLAEGGDYPTPSLVEKVLDLIYESYESNRTLLERIRRGLPERKVLPTVQEQYAHPIIRMKEAEQAEFNRALDQVTALLDKELE